MTKRLSIFSLLILTFTVQGYAQKKSFNIRGLWEVYSSLPDTVNPESVQMWSLFDQSNVSALMAPNYLFASGIHATEKYTFKNDTLKTFSDGKTTVTVVSVLNNNLMQFSIIASKEKEVFYLKRVIKRKVKPD